MDEKFEQRPVASIHFFDSGEDIEYNTAEAFEKSFKHENYYGAPMEVTLYIQADGGVIPHDFVYNADPPIQGFNIKEYPRQEIIGETDLEDSLSIE